MSRRRPLPGAAVQLALLMVFKAAWADAVDAPGATTAAALPRYVDRVLDEGPQDPRSLRTTDAGDTSPGWPRGVQIEQAWTRGSFVPAAAQRTLSVQGFVEPTGWGVVSFACAGGRGEGSGAGLGCPSRRLDWRALPLRGGWVANFSAGQHAAPANPLAVGLSRALTPAVALDGVSGQWRLGESAEFNAYLGSPGSTGPAGFESGADPAVRIASAGGKVRFEDPASSGARVDVAVQALTASASPLRLAAPVGADRSVRALWSSIAWERGPGDSGPGLRWDSLADPALMAPGGMRLQASWLHSVRPEGRSADGAWLEAAARVGGWAHAGGLFSFGSGLAWGTGQVVNDLQGAYWRGSTQSARWSLGWSTELSRRPQAGSATATYASAFAQYRIDTRTVAGSTLTWRRGPFPAEGLQWRWDSTTDWGPSSVRLDTLRTVDSRVLSVSADQGVAQWATGALSASLGWQTQTFARSVDRSVNWGVMLTEAPSATTQVDLFLRGTHGHRARSLSADLMAQWRLSADWTLFLRHANVLTETASAARLESALDSALIAIDGTRAASRFAQVLLRFQARGGSAVVPLGGRAGDGAGEIAGVVFQDRNGNDRRDASEAGVADVTLVLDGRYVTRTDAQGRYTFAPVAAGRHSLLIQLESVPLPWTPTVQAAQAVWVDVRQTRRLDLGLQAIR